ncbi:hypothetical protein CPB83DRAFT_900515 [Crepidotus variabilis]|uniref:Uncharacterized protein n=1 Tax=Crepidotus variabilis TaxID=179855 RepID=A0A9P6E317_9AGAR|nr:hypothetical protein CPB83DRAFT_900515 [Crepidotus variabilis]
MPPATAVVPSTAPFDGSVFWRHHECLTAVANDLSNPKDVLALALTCSNATPTGVMRLWSRFQHCLLPLIRTLPSRCLESKALMGHKVCQEPCPECRALMHRSFVPDAVTSSEWTRFAITTNYYEKLVLNMECGTMRFVFSKLVDFIAASPHLKASEIFCHLKSLHIVGLLETDTLARFLELVHPEKRCKQIKTIIFEDCCVGTAMALITNTEHLSDVEKLSITVNGHENEILLGKASVSMLGITFLDLSFYYNPDKSVFVVLPQLPRLETLSITIAFCDDEPDPGWDFKKCESTVLPSLRSLLVTSPFNEHVYGMALMYRMPVLTSARFECRAQATKPELYSRVLASLSSSTELRELAIVFRPDEDAFSMFTQDVPLEGITDEVLAPVARWPKLESMEFFPMIPFDDVTDSVLLLIAKACPRLKIFNLGGGSSLLRETPAATHASVEGFCRYARDLELLYFPHVLPFLSDTCSYDFPAHHQLATLGGMSKGPTLIYADIVTALFPSLEHVVIHGAVESHIAERLWDRTSPYFVLMGESTCYCEGMFMGV